MPVMAANPAGGERARIYDLVVIGGGVNGVWVARDAAGRGLSVLLCEQNDLASATSSASSKLIHGGLRYLEHYEFRLVREALQEREILLHNALHLIRPMRFVLPVTAAGRPPWMLRAGLWLYDHIGGRRSLPGTETLDLAAAPYAGTLKPELTRGFAYSDCWVDDSRFVVLNAVDAARHGAEILTRTRCLEARREGNRWRVRLRDARGTESEVRARALVNAAGPWVASVLSNVAGVNARAGIRLVKGSHIVVPRLYDGAHAFILQAPDGRVVFVLPFEGTYSMIGTTDVNVPGETYFNGAGAPQITPEETGYLCDTVNAYFTRPVGPEDVVWTFSGVRPLYDDGASEASQVTRDYVIEVDSPEGQAPVVSVFGGKVTTARRLADAVLARLADRFMTMQPAWTDEALLPGGEMDDFAVFVEELVSDYPAFEPAWLRGLAARHGTRARAVIGTARKPTDLGWNFGGGLYGAEVDFMMSEEFAVEPDDILWRRSKVGLAIDAQGYASLADYMSRRRSG